MSAGPIWFTVPPPPATVPAPPARPEPEAVAVTIDGRKVEAPAGATILDACRSAGIDVPTLCYLETLTPVNACRVCVVEVEGARVLAQRPLRADLQPDAKLPADSRLWAALQDVSGGTWGGCVFDVDTIVETLEAGKKALAAAQSA